MCYNNNKLHNGSNDMGLTEISVIKRVPRIMYVAQACALIKGPRQDGRHFADDIFRCIFVNCIFIKISPKLVSKGPIDNTQHCVS